MVAVILVGRRWLSALSWDQVGERLLLADPVWVGVSVLFLLARFATWDQRWRLALARADSLPTRLRSFFALQAAVLVNHVTPAARVLGGLVRARYVERGVDQTFGHVYGAVLFDVVAHQVMIVIVTGLSGLGLLWISGHEIIALSGLVLMLLLAAGGTYLAAVPAGRTERLGEWVAARSRRRSRGVGIVMSQGGEAVRVLGTLFRRPRLRRWAVLLGLLLFLFQASAQTAVYRSLGLQVSFVAVFVAVAIGNVSGGISGIPGGLGAAEAGMIFSYQLLGVTGVEAVAGTLLFRGLHYATVAALGVPAVVAFEVFDEVGPSAEDDLE